jgi:long-chain fatty acid transport protein
MPVHRGATLPLRVENAMHHPRFVPLASWVALLLVPRVAGGSGLSIARFGGEHGTPMTTEPTAIYYNPSGIADSEGGHVMADLNIAARRATYTHSPAASDAMPPSGLEGANAGRATLFNVLVEPFVGATYKLGHLAVGAAFYTPFGGQETWDQNGTYRGNRNAAGAVDGVQRWYILNGEIRSSFLSAAAAYDFGRLSVGVSANAIQTIVNTVQARNANGDNDVSSEGRAWLDTSSWDFSMGVGVTFKPTERMRIGLSYQSRPGFGNGIRAGGDLHTAFAGSSSTSRVGFITDLPDVFRAGVSFRPRNDVEVRLFGDYQRWSVLDHQCIAAGNSGCSIRPDGSANAGSDVVLNYRREWNDTFGVRAGASYWVRPEVELMAGAGYSSNAVPDSTLEPALLDFDAISASLGARFHPLARLGIGATYTQVFYLSRDTTGKSVDPTLLPPSRSPDSGGKYSLALGLLNLNADFAF